MIEIVLIVVAAVAGTIAIGTIGILVCTLKKRKSPENRNIPEVFSAAEVLDASRLHEKYYPRAALRHTSRSSPNNQRYFMPYYNYTPPHKPAPRLYSIRSVSTKFDEFASMRKKGSESVRSLTGQFLSQQLSQGPSAVTLRNEVSDVPKQQLSDFLSSDDVSVFESTPYSITPPLCEHLDRLDEVSQVPEIPDQSHCRGRRASQGAQSIILSYIRQYSSSPCSSVSSASVKDDMSVNEAEVDSIQESAEEQKSRDNSVPDRTSTPLELPDDSISVPQIMTASRMVVSTTSVNTEVIITTSPIQSRSSMSDKSSSIVYGIAYTTVDSSHKSSTTSNPPELTMDDDPFKDTDSVYSWSPVTERFAHTSSTPKRGKHARKLTPHINKLATPRTAVDSPTHIMRYSSHSPKQRFYNFKDISFPLPCDELTTV